MIRKLIDYGYIAPEHAGLSVRAGPTARRRLAFPNQPKPPTKGTGPEKSFSKLTIRLEYAF